MPKQQRPIQMLSAAQRAARTPASAIKAPADGISGSNLAMAQAMDDFADEVQLRAIDVARRFRVDTKSVIEHIWRRANGLA
jgi:hypothetical protein